MKRSSTSSSASSARGGARASTNVQVVVRCRPQNERERAAREPVIVSTDGERNEVHVRQRFSAAVSDKIKRFTFTPTGVMPSRHQYTMTPANDMFKFRFIYLTGVVPGQ